MEIVKSVKKKKWDYSTLQFVQSAGAEICYRLRGMKYPDEKMDMKKSWVLAEMLSKIKSAGRHFFPEHTESEVLTELRKFTDDDLQEAIEYTERKKDEKSRNV